MHCFSKGAKPTLWYINFTKHLRQPKTEELGWQLGWQRSTHLIMFKPFDLWSMWLFMNNLRTNGRGRAYGGEEVWLKISKNILWTSRFGGDRGFKIPIYTLNILLALFGLCNGTPPTVLMLGPWNFQRRWAMLWGWSAREDFLIPPPQPAPGSKRCRQIRSGGPSAYFRASFAKYKLLGIVWGVI